MEIFGKPVGNNMSPIRDTRADEDMSKEYPELDEFAENEKVLF